MAETVEKIAPVRSSVSVPLVPERAFRLFTEEMGSWWPLDSHSINGSEATGVKVEPRVGGRVFETPPGDGEAEWGRVTAWEPPRLFAMTWHPGFEAERATLVEVTFSGTAEGGTLVELVHGGWEALGEGATAARTGYEQGWPIVLGRFADAAPTA
jgi:uncharacterized protein YndB with AHSA1/START domain